MGFGSFTGGLSDACGRCKHPNFGIYGDLEVLGRWVAWKKELMCIGSCLVKDVDSSSSVKHPFSLRSCCFEEPLLITDISLSGSDSFWSTYSLSQSPSQLKWQHMAQWPVKTRGCYLLWCLEILTETSLSMAERKSVSPWSFKKCPLLLECLYLEQIDPLDG